MGARLSGAQHRLHEALARRSAMRVRIVVAAQSEARFYDTDHFDSDLKLVGRLTDPKARLHDRDFKSDRPGRVYDHAPPATGRRGGVGHHGTGGERHPHRHEAGLFAHQIAAALESALRQDQFKRLVLVAGPRFLGELRAALSKSVDSTVAVQVRKDLVHAADKVVHQYLPREIFAELM
jgi:protein required for attachment to host cells